MNTILICVVFVDLARGKGVEQGIKGGLKGSYRLVRTFVG